MIASGSLRSVQRALHDHLLDRRGGIDREVRSGAGIGVAARLHVYHHAYRARLLAALRDTFEKVHCYVGDERFDAVALAYIEAHPPTQRNLRWYGDGFAAFAGGHCGHEPEVGELAMLDARLRDAFDGADDTPITVESLARVAPEQWEHLACRFVPTLRVDPVTRNTAAIWHALDSDATPPPSAPTRDPQWILTWRREWQPHFRSIGAFEARAISLLQEGRGIAATCAQLDPLLDDGSAAVTVAAMLHGWIGEGLVGSLITATRSP